MKSIKQESTHQKRFKYLENQTIQLVKKSRMQIRKVNKGCDPRVQNYDKSKKVCLSYRCTLSSVLRTAHAHVCICLYVYVCV